MRKAGLGAYGLGKRLCLHVHQGVDAQARYEFLPDDGSYYGENPGINGVFANAATLEACRDELRDVLEGWLLLRQQLYKDRSI